MDDDIGAERERLAEVRRRHRIVDEKRYAMRVRELRERRDVDDVELRIADGLDVDEPRALRERRAEIRHAVARRVAHADAIAREIAKERARAAVESARCEDLIALRENVEHGVRYSRHAGCAGHGADAALERVHTLLEARDGRIIHARVDEARLASREDARHLLCRRLIERRGLIERLRRRPRRRVRRERLVQEPRGEPHERPPFSTMSSYVPSSF